VVTVAGKAFFDIDHASKDHSNRRINLSGYAAWEIHPVMSLEILSTWNSAGFGPAILRN
jgi:hypothetical protein